MPEVSIVLPTWNVAHLLRDAVESVRAQTHTDWELIVVDDGSTDETKTYLESLMDARIAVIPSAHTGRPGLLRNRGVARAQADIIAFLDSDDLWEPDKLEVQLPALRDEPTFDWSYTNTLVIDECGRDITSTVTPWEPHSGMILDQLLRLEARVSLSTVMIRTRVFAYEGGFDPDSGVEDYDAHRLAPRRCGHSATAHAHALPTGFVPVGPRDGASCMAAALHEGSRKWGFGRNEAILRSQRAPASAVRGQLPRPHGPPRRSGARPFSCNSPRPALPCGPENVPGNGPVDHRAMKLC